MTFFSYPSRFPSWHVLAWLGSGVVSFAACWKLGAAEGIGRISGQATALHAILMLCLIPLISLFPWKKHASLWILGFAALTRILLLPMEPADDVHRYVWEGRVLQAGMNPYMISPEDPSLSHLRDGHWDKINNKHMTAIYPPGSLLLFQALASLTSSPAGFKMTLTVVDLLCVALLLALLRQHQRNPAWALLYALNPVVLLAFAGEGHLDVLLVFFLLLSLICHARKWFPAMFIFLACAIHAKYMALFLVPFVLTRPAWRFAWLLPTATLLPTIPFSPFQGLFTSLGEFATEMHYNGSMHALMAQALDSFPAASGFAAALMLSWLACVRAMTDRPLEAGALVMGGLLLLAPTVHFWYLTWVLPFLVFYPLRPLLILCFTIALQFQTQGTMYATGEWKQYPWLVVLEYTPVYGALLCSIFSRCLVPRGMPDGAPRPTVHELSVIVPVLNEELVLPHFLEQAKQLNGSATEIIFCDGGSTDGTVALVTGAGYQLVHSPPGRGTQIRAGLRASSSDAVLIAHADMTIDVGLPKRILRALNRSGADGGSVGCRFEDAGPFLHFISALNSVRARVFGISFGDQGQFFRFNALDSMGGYPDLPIMEDVELSIRLKKHSRPAYLGGGLEVSSRGWKKRGHCRNAALVFHLCTLYIARRLLAPGTPDVSDLYAAYYGRP